MNEILKTNSRFHSIKKKKKVTCHKAGAIQRQNSFYFCNVQQPKVISTDHIEALGL